MGETDLATRSFPWSTMSEDLRKVGWASLVKGILRPFYYLTVPANAETGPRYMAYTYGLYCIVPVMAINIFISVVQGATRIFDFDDINPVTLSVAAIPQFALALFTGWVFGWTLYAGLKVTGAVEQSHKEHVRSLAWVITAAVYSLGMWWIGVSLPGYVILESLGVPIDALEGMVMIILWAAIIFGIRVLIAAPAATLGKSVLATLPGVVVGCVLLMIALAPVSLILQTIVFAILMAFV